MATTPEGAMRSRLKLWLSQWWPYLLLAFVILGPLWLPGYIFTMDMVFAPHPPIPTEPSASLPFYFALHYLSYLIPGDVLQKLLLFGILLAAGVGMDRLLRQVFAEKLSRWAIVAASLFYMTSAFVYERLMMGQWAVVAGYALLPFVVTALLRFLQTPTWRRLWWLVGWALLLAIMSIHTLIPAALLGVLIVFSKWREWRQYLGKLAIGLGTFLILSSYWLVPTLLNTNTIGAALRASGDGQAFATHGGIVSLLRLQGMWAEAYGLFPLPQDVTIVPGIWQTAIWVVVGIGFVTLWRRRRRLALLSLTLIVASCLIALVGLGDIYREPHKIMVLAALAMAVLGAVGVDTALRRLERTKPSLVPAAGLLASVVPLFLAAGMLWGFWGQLSVRAYPAEWYALQQQLQKLPNDKPALFVPWHLYQRYSFSPRIVANPAPSFFEGRRVIVNNDPEFTTSQPLRHDPLVSTIDRLLAEKSPTIATQLRQLGVGSIIFAQEPGYEDVEFLRQASGLEEVFRQGTLTLYVVKGAS